MLQGAGSYQGQQAARDPRRKHGLCEERPSQVVLDQILTVDKTRLIKKIGHCSPSESRKISDVLVELFEM